MTRHCTVTTDVGVPPLPPPGYGPPSQVSDPVAAIAQPAWTRWRCESSPAALRPNGQHPAADTPPPHVVELRQAANGADLLAAVRSQARLDGHRGVVSIHRATLDNDGRAEVQLGWAGPTLASQLAERSKVDPRLPDADVVRIGVDIASTLADAHALRPPLIHGALDATTVRLDRWGRARLDGFGAGGSQTSRTTTWGDVDALLKLLRQLLDGRSPEERAHGRPASVMVEAALDATRATPHLVDARRVARALATIADVHPRPSTSYPQVSGLLGKAPIGAGSTHTGSDPNATASGSHPGTARPGDADDPTTCLTEANVEHESLRFEANLPDALVALRYLGRGGHGQVTLARDPLLARPVVVKQYRSAGSTGPSVVGTTTTPADATEAATRELTALRLLDGHPASVECYGFDPGEPPNRPPTVVLSCCDGGQLDPAQSWSAEALAQLGAQVADALGVLHARGLVHADVKPHNLLVDRWGAVRLADFSVTSPAGADALGECSPRHAPPEQLRSEPLHPGVDLAGLAATLYHLGEGRPPFEQGDGTPALVARRLAGEVALRPSSLESLPELADWVMAHLEPDRAKRPPGGAAVAAATLRRVGASGCDAEGSVLVDDVAGGNFGPPLRRPNKDGNRKPGSLLGSRPTALVALTAVALVGLLVANAVFSSAPRDGDDQRIQTLQVAQRLPAADPLGAAEAPGLELRLGASGDAVLVRTDTSNSTSWVVRRDDFHAKVGLASNDPSASGLVGPDGRVASEKATGAGPEIFSRDHRALQLPVADAEPGAISCVRMVTVADPPVVSSSLCWG